MNTLCALHRHLPRKYDPNGSNDTAVVNLKEISAQFVFVPFVHTVHSSAESLKMPFQLCNARPVSLCWKGIFQFLSICLSQAMQNIPKRLKSIDSASRDVKGPRSMSHVRLNAPLGPAAFHQQPDKTMPCAQTNFLCCL